MCFERSTSTLLSESLRFPQRGRQRERHNSFLCFPSKKLTAKIYKKRLTGQFNSRNATQENKTKASIRILEKNQVDLQTLQFFRSSVLFLAAPVLVVNSVLQVRQLSVLCSSLLALYFILSRDVPILKSFSAGRLKIIDCCSGGCPAVAAVDELC